MVLILGLLESGQPEGAAGKRCPQAFAAVDPDLASDVY